MGEWPMPNPPEADDEGRMCDDFDSHGSEPLTTRGWSSGESPLGEFVQDGGPSPEGTLLHFEMVEGEGVSIKDGMATLWEKIDGEWHERAATMLESYETDVGIPTERGAMSDDPQEPLKFPIPTLASIRRQLREEFGKPPCPGGHTPEPRLYLPQAAWAEEMLETHAQVRCPDCGLWAIWVPKKGVSVEDANRARRRLARKYGVSRGSGG